MHCNLVDRSTDLLFFGPKFFFYNHEAKKNEAGGDREVRTLKYTGTVGYTRMYHTSYLLIQVVALRLLRFEIDLNGLKFRSSKP